MWHLNFFVRVFVWRTEKNIDDFIFESISDYFFGVALAIYNLTEFRFDFTMIVSITVFSV